MRIIKNTIKFIAVSTLFLSSCTKGFEEMNIDPNNIDKVVPGSLMAPMLYDMGKFSSNRNYDFTWQLMQVGLPYPATATGVHRYDVTPTAGNGTWNSCYVWLRNIEEMEEAAVTSNQPIYGAVAKTLRAYVGGILTDAFGDVPLSEAIKLDEGINKPVFDEQKDIYLKLIQDLEDANNLYVTVEGAMTGNDILFNNDKSKWRKFNNSLLLRMILRMSKRAEMDSYNRIKAIISNPEGYPIFESNAEAALLKISGLSPYDYPWGRRQDYTLNEAKAEFFVNMLNEFNDPRRPLFMSLASRVVDGKIIEIGYKGIPSAYGPTQSFDYSPSIPNPDLMVPSTLGTIINEVIMSYAEVEFIKAEMYLHFSDFANAEKAYVKGITAAVTQWPKGTMPANYFDNPAVAFNQSLEQVLNQKYLALYMSDYQQWFEYRRTGFPILPKTENMLHDGEMPKRFQYHDRVKITNPENYEDAVSKMELGDNVLSPVWWEK